MANFDQEKAKKVRNLIEYLLEHHPEDIRLHCEHEVLWLCSDIKFTAAEKTQMVKFGAHFDQSDDAWKIYVSA